MVRPFPHSTTPRPRDGEGFSRSCIPPSLGLRDGPGDEAGPTLQLGLAVHAGVHVELADLSAKARRVWHDFVKVDVLGEAVEQAAEPPLRARVLRDVGVLWISDDAPGVRQLAPHLERSGEGNGRVLVGGAAEQRPLEGWVETVAPLLDVARETALSR